MKGERKVNEPLARVPYRGRFYRWRFNRLAAWKLRRFARAQYGPGALDYLESFQTRVLDSGQDFRLIPGHAIIARAVKVERRKARLARLPNPGKPS